MVDAAIIAKSGELFRGSLKTLPANKLKIDQSFVKHLPDSNDGAAIVDTILTLGSRMGLEIQAEGIETEAQMHYLRDSRCELGQGYWFGRPLLSDAFVQLLSQGHSEVRLLGQQAECADV